jgi:hypothetical protein
MTTIATFEMKDYESGSEAWGCSTAQIEMAARRVADKVMILAPGRYRLTLERRETDSTPATESEKEAHDAHR